MGIIKNKKLIMMLLIGGLFAVLFSQAFAQGAGVYTLNVPIPGAPKTFTNPVEYIISLYNVALGAGSLIAMIIIIFAGIKRIVSAGNPPQISEANNMMINAVVGLAMLAGAFIILRTIDPRLVRLKTLALDAPKIERVLDTKYAAALQENKKASEEEQKQKQFRDDLFKKWFPDIPSSWNTDPNFPTYETAFADLKKEKDLTPEEIKKLRIDFAEANLKWYKAGEERWKTEVVRQHEEIQAHLNGHPSKKPEGIVDTVTDYIPAINLAKKGIRAVSTTDEDLWQRGMDGLQKRLRDLDNTYADAQQNRANAEKVLSEVK